MKQLTKISLASVASILIGMTDAIAATVTLTRTVGPQTGFTCGTAPVESDIRTIEPFPTRPAIPVDSPVVVDPPFSTILPIIQSEVTPTCDVAAAAQGGSGFVAVKGFANSNGAPVNVDALANLDAVDIFLRPRGQLSFAQLRQRHGSDIRVRPNTSLIGSIVEVASIVATVEVSGTNSLGRLQTEIEQQILNISSPSQGTFVPNPLFPGGDGILIDPTRPLQLSMRLSGRASSSRDRQGEFDSFNSLSFATDGPAFFLPDGYTIDAPALSIFDNQWIDPRVTAPQPAPSTVPLPASALLLFFGIGGLAALKRQKKSAN